MLETTHNLACRHGDDYKYQLYLQNFWKPTLSVIGFDGLPSVEAAGNVLYKELRCKVSIRMPPTLHGSKAEQIIRDKLLEKKDETFNAIVEVDF